MTQRALLIGLTGGIASGKSTVSTRLRQLGAIIVDADQIAREVVAPGTAGLADVVEAFGPEILDADGAMDRAAVGAIVFADPAQREVLNSIIHPRVRQQATQIIEQAGPSDVVVQDIPLLVETGQADEFDVVVVVQAPEQIRIQRMIELRGMTEHDARARIAAQATDAQRAAVAHKIFYNDSTVATLRTQVDGWWEEEVLPLLRQR